MNAPGPTASRNFVIATTKQWFGRSLLLWLVGAIGFGVWLSTVPLLGSLGFEHSLAAAVLASIAGIDLGGRAMRRSARVNRHASLLVAAAAAAAAAMLVAITPFAIGALRSPWRPVCDWRFALETTVAMPMISAIFAAVSGATAAALVGPHRRWLARLAPIGALLATAAVGLWRFYAAPSVFSFSPIVGFFPGNLYDEHIELTAAFWWARLDTALWLAGWLLVTHAVRQWRKRLPSGWASGWASLAATAAFASWAAVRSQHASHGYALTAADVAAQLGATIETPHFVIHYDPRADFVDEIALIAADHEFRYSQVVGQTKRHASRPIHSYYFGSAEAKARLLGARDVEMAKPWRHEIYLDHREFPHPSLRHEIAHVLAGEFGDPWFAVSARRIAGMPMMVNPGLIEGMAVALDWPGGYDRTLTPHQAVRVMQAIGVEPEIDALLSLGFLRFSSARSYTTAGSFVAFLFTHYGTERALAYYRNGGDLQAAVGEPTATVVQRWRDFLQTVAVSDSDIAATKERFRGGSVFDRPCPHAIARALRDAVRLASDDRGAALAALRSICRQDPHEPTHQLLLAAFLDQGEASEQAEAKQLRLAIAQNANHSPAILINAWQAIAQRAVQAGDLAVARDAIAQAALQPADQGQARTLLLTQWALQGDELFHHALRGYIFSAVGEPAMLAWAQAVARTTPPASLGPGALGIGAYLVGLRQLAAHDWPAASTALRAALDAGLPSPLFHRNAARLLMKAAFRNQDVAQAQFAADVLHHHGNEVDRYFADDWLARMAFATQAPR